MKPREFDDLIKQKFEQNDFAYNPKNWDSLAEQLEGRSKKRSMIMWLWMPAAGMAASVALAVGVTSLLNFGVPTGNGGSQYAGTGKFMPHKQVVQQEIAMIPYPAPYEEAVQQRPAKKVIRNIAKPVEKSATVAGIGIKLQNVLNSSVDQGANSGLAVVENSAPPVKAALPKIEKKAVAAQQVYHTFKQEETTFKKPLNLSIILTGGVSQGSHNSGYMAGATVRKMVSDKVYVEGDIAFTTSSNVQRNLVASNGAAGAPVVGSAGGSGTIAAKSSSSSSDTMGVNKVTINAASTPISYKTQDIPYSSYYAQVTPGIGYKVMKRMSIGMGADFQQMLVDNRPATSDVDRGNIQVAPTFDVGFVGKTEYALTQRVKAAVSYRKGINGVINPSDKFIDRDYVQFQMRCTIFNR